MAQVGSLVVMAFVVHEALRALGSVALLTMVHLGPSSPPSVWWTVGVVLPLASALAFSIMLVWVALVGTRRPPQRAGSLLVNLGAIVVLFVARLVLMASDLAQGMILTRLVVGGGIDVEAFYMARSTGWMIGHVIQGLGMSAALIGFAFRRGAGR